MQERLDDEADTVRAWLRQVLHLTGLKPSQLAKAAGLAPSTVLRALDETATSSLERSSIRKIIKAFSVAGPDEADMRAPGFSDTAELLPYGLEPPAELEPNQYIKLANTRALELAGVLPGDLLTFDMSLPPAPGDTVEAQIYDGGAAATALRLYDPPYLITRTADPALPTKPLLVDGQRVRIAAVLIRCARTRRPPRN